MKNTKKLAYIGIFAALYFVLSLTLKIPLVGHISLDLGYLALTVAAITLGAVPAGLVGAIGATFESILLSPFGWSPSWTVMNIIVGLIVGYVLHKREYITWFSTICVILFAVFLGVCAKTVIECCLYSIPLLVKLPKAITAFIIDSGVMICGVPLARRLNKKFLS